MTRRVPTLIALIVLAAMAGCSRELSGAQCPCLDGWMCCEEQNRCVPEGKACETADDRDRVDAAQSAAADVCDGEREPATHTCPGGPFAFAGLGAPKATAAALVGRWQVCGGTGFRWGPENAHSGIEFARDGKFYLLGEDDDGALQRVIGLRATGTYKVEEYGGVAFTFPEGGGASFFPSFDAQRAHLHAGGDSGFDSDYARVAAGADHVPGVVVPGACRRGDAGIDGSAVSDAGANDASACEGGFTLSCPGAPFAFAPPLGLGHESVQALLEGRWQLCEGNGLSFGPKNARSGIEFTRDGKFFLLGLDADGVLQRVVGLRTTGMYSSQELGKWVQVDLFFPEGGNASLTPSFDAERNHFHQAEGVNTDLIYVRVPVDADNAAVVHTPVACEQGSDAGMMCEVRMCPGAPFAFAPLGSQSATLQALVGRWQLCEGWGFVKRSLQSAAGVEFTADGSFHFLDADAYGALQRTTGLYSTASYGTEGAQDDAQVLVEFPEGVVSRFYPSFDAEKKHLHVVRDFGLEGSYVLVPPEQGSVPGVSLMAACPQPAASR